VPHVFRLPVSCMLCGALGVAYRCSGFRPVSL
jgi:hypothetical protein